VSLLCLCRSSSSSRCRFLRLSALESLKTPLQVAVSSKLKLLPVPARLTAQIFSCRRIGAQPAARPLLFSLSNLALVLLLAVAFLALLVLETLPRAATLNRSLNRSQGGSQNGFSNSFSLCCKVVTLQTKPVSYDSCVSRPLE
jgi:hypothetical protein